MLCRTENSIVPAKEYTHAGIYVGENKVIESRRLKGVDYYPLSDWFLQNDVTYVRVLRVKTADPDTRNIAAQFVVNQVGKRYDYQSIFLGRKQDGSEGAFRNKWYCSELVWAAYYNASNGSINFDQDGKYVVSPDEINNDDDIEIVGEHKEKKPETKWDKIFGGIAHCPIDIEVVSPDGQILSKQINEILGSIYEEVDVNNDSNIDDLFVIPAPKIGSYSIILMPEPNALPEDTFSFKVGYGENFIVYFENIPISNIPVDPFLVTISEEGHNCLPIADAGLDQAVIYINTIVQLNGNQSWDPEGDALTYLWGIMQRPEGSDASLDDPNSPAPTIIPDVYGEYKIKLVVSDQWNSSNPDEIVVSFLNIKPVADAGDNQSGIVGDTFILDGSASSDPNGDNINFHWQIVSKPDRSNTQLSDSSIVNPTIQPDLSGEYVINLFVDDGLLISEPSMITISAISVQDAITQKLQEIINVINGLPKNVFKNKSMPKTITKKLNEVIIKVDNNEYTDALNKLENDILKKTNGCAEIGEPDKNDWIIDCESQHRVYSLIIEAINLLNDLK